MKTLFYTKFRQQLYSIVAFLGVFNCTVSCTPKISIIENIHFSEALALSQTTQKPIFFMIGGGKNCIPCHDLKKQLRASKTLSQLKDSFIFYMCNVNNPKNDFIYKSLLPQTVPNYYIINTAGNVVTFSFAPIDNERIFYELKSYLAGTPKCFDIHQGFYNLSSDSLLMMQNLLIKANLSLFQKKYEKSLEYVEKSITIYPYLYNNYLKYKLHSYLGTKQGIDSLAYIALQYDNNNNSQSIVYETYINELKTVAKSQESASNKAACIEVLNSTIQCGEIRLGEEKTYEFKFINIGESPLIILNVSSSCGCTKSTWKRAPVKQNETGTISVKFKADSYGRFSRTLTIQANGKKAMEKITLQGVIK